jgi:hypothetical protein
MPALALHTIHDRVEKLAIGETLHVETNDSNPLYIRRDGEQEYYAWHTRQDKSLQSYTGSIDGLMRIVSELRRGIGQAKNKVKPC